MKLAALYDIHGNLPALDAVLVEIEGLGVDLIVVGGDIVWGPMPRRTLDRLRNLKTEVRFIRGNADREVARRITTAADALVNEITSWCADRLDEDDLEFLERLPETSVVEGGDLGPILFCHGSPRSDEEKITPLTSDAEMEEMLTDVPQNMVVCGHTHMQFDRRVGRHRIINAGSVGLPYEGIRGVFWALIGDDVELRRSDYDFEAAATAIRGSGCPAPEELIEHLRNPPTREQAVEAFGS